MLVNIELADYSHSARWSVRLGLFMAMYIIGASALNPHHFANLADIYANKFLTGMPILMLGGVCSAALIHGRGEPLRYAKELVADRWRSSFLILAFFFGALIAFNTYKIAIPSVVPYYADPWLADLDEWLHGAPPWELAHRFSSETWSMIVFNAYEVIWFFQWFGTVLFVSLWSDRAASIRYLWAGALTLCILGTVTALAMASAGPVYYGELVAGERFGGLIAAVDQLSYGYMVQEPAAYLLEAYRSGRPEIGGGISAMPSMHVAFVTLNAFLLSSLNRWLGIAGWLFTALILYGSVFTGWHYAVDGYVSIIVVSLIWWITGRFVREEEAAYEPGSSSKL